ncbi:MAG: rRNA maturation RNase YbeY [Planctomycetes bacterium RBG_13_44_8b]|nr:MAG: rRNA maturation RNase YbeY [Planctomycetes bacterium RBG_13_44_8b]
MEMTKPMPDKKDASGIIININVSCRSVRFDRQKLADMLRSTSGRFGVKKAVINCAVLSDEEMKKINRKFLKKNSATDVISFDISDKDDLEIFDIAVNAEMAKRQAENRGLKPKYELALYFLHGLLHNLGFDDSTSCKAAKMHKVEDQILQRFGYGIVYKEVKR